MPLTVIACACGSSETTARNFLKSAGYQNWLTIPVFKGKEKSLIALDSVPPAPEKEMLLSFLRNASKWVVIIGYDENGNMRWSDISHNAPRSTIEAQFVVETFASRP